MPFWFLVGDVYIKSNQGLCYTNKVKWKSFFIHPKTQRAYVQRSKKNCGKFNLACETTYSLLLIAIICNIQSQEFLELNIQLLSIGTIHIFLIFSFKNIFACV